ncbi:MAG: indolepyruvate ferredoxin oxidoreductase subunit alpha [Anaerolineae bacterium]
MKDKQTIWVDAGRCTGCGACVPVCPTGAIGLVEGKARVDEAACTGCGVCIEQCPEGAIQPAIQGELVPVPERPAPTLYRPSPLVETAGAAVAAAGTGLLMRAAGRLVRAAGRWLMRRLSGGSSPSRMARGSAAETPSPAGEGMGGGRRVRRRGRGG